MKSKWMLLLIAVTGLSTFALAKEGEDKPMKDKKPRMTPEEKFAKLDTNGDGVLSLEEFTAKPERPGKKDKGEPTPEGE